MVQTKGQIVENSNLLFRLHHQRFYPKEFTALQTGFYPSMKVDLYSIL